MMEDHSVPCRVIMLHFFPLRAKSLIVGSFFLKLLASSTRHICESVFLLYVPVITCKKIFHIMRPLKDIWIFCGSTFLHIYIQHILFHPPYCRPLAQEVTRTNTSHHKDYLIVSFKEHDDPGNNVNLTRS